MRKLIIFITFFCCLPQVFPQAKYYIDDPKNILKINPLERYGPKWDPNENKAFIKDAGVNRSFNYWSMLGENKDALLSFLDTGKPELYIEKQYDTNGNVTKEIIKASDEDRVSYFFYNSKDLLTKYISYEDSAIDYDCNLTYDSTGNVIQIIVSSNSYYKRQKTFFVYDSLNNLIEENNYNDDTISNRNNRINYKYDKFGNNIEKKTIYLKSNDTDFIKYNIEYDNQNKIIYRAGFDKSGKMLNEEKYDYEDGVISKIFYNWGEANEIVKYNKEGLLVSIKRIDKRANGKEIQLNTNYYNKHNLIIKILIKASYKNWKHYMVTLYSYEYR